MSEIRGVLALVEVAFIEDEDKWNRMPPSMRDNVDEVDGVVVYEAKYVRGGDGPFKHPVRQPFSEDGMKQVAGKNVWNWDGDRDNPTLNDSFGWGKQNGDWILHFFFQDGEINPCNDMLLDAVTYGELTDWSP